MKRRVARENNSHDSRCDESEKVESPLKITPVLSLRTAGKTIALLSVPRFHAGYRSAPDYIYQAGPEYKYL